MITWCFDTREVFIAWLELKGYNQGNSRSYRNIRWITGWAVKFFALFVLVKQERGRIVRWMTNNSYKQDSGMEVYNLFNGRSDLIG